MFFTQFEFFIFAFLLLALLALIKDNRVRKLLLIVSSLFFYGYWDVRFLALLIGVTVINYLCGLKIAEVSGHRKKWLIGAVVFNVGLLGIFKYYNFFVSSLEALFPELPLKSLHWLLPLGISFFTFQNISYAVDVYQKKCDVCRSFSDFSLFILYFPKLMVGPIVRAADFLPQLEKKPLPTFDKCFSGVRQFIFGLFQKLFVADSLALFVNPVWGNHAVYDTATIWLAVLAYTLQIYCDFSGYSNMAIGFSRLVGYELCENFKLPYLSASITDFWRRWHISLSTWLRDYLYIPLGGNRKGVARSYLNQMITMLLGGLWHGAAWTFVFWGAWHGAALVVSKWFKRRYGDRFSIPEIIGVVLTLFVVIIGWIFFRSESFPQAFAIIKSMFLPAQGVRWIEPVSASLVAGGLLLHAAARRGWHKPFTEGPCSLRNCTLLWLLLLTVLVFKPSVFQPFVYNQF